MRAGNCIIYQEAFVVTFNLFLSLFNIHTSCLYEGFYVYFCDSQISIKNVDLQKTRTESRERSARIDADIVI